MNAQQDTYGIDRPRSYSTRCQESPTPAVHTFGKCVGTDVQCTMILNRKYIPVHNIASLLNIILDYALTSHDAQ